MKVMGAETDAGRVALGHRQSICSLADFGWLFGAFWCIVPECSGKKRIGSAQMAHIASFHIIVLFSLFSSFSDVIDVS